MSNVRRLFKLRHIRLLTLLIVLDLIATIIWFVYFGIEEANPLLESSIKESPLKFAVIKLGLSVPGLYILANHIEKKVAQGGIGILLFFYSLVAIIHFFILTVVLPSSLICI